MENCQFRVDLSVKDHERRLQGDRPGRNPGRPLDPTIRCDGEERLSTRSLVRTLHPDGRVE